MRGVSSIPVSVVCLFVLLERTHAGFFYYKDNITPAECLSNIENCKGKLKT
jgi:hypothetical protein